MNLRLLAAFILLPALAWAQDPAAPGHWPAALAGVANMGFADDQPGDGAGGWSDQGWANSFAEFEVARREFGGVPFAITDPAANHGKGVVSFRHRTLPNAPETVTAPFPTGARGRWLYLLHAVCWAGGPRGTVVGQAVVTGRDGTERKLDLALGREVGDWWNPVSLPNGAVVGTRPNQSALVGVYLSRLDLGGEVEAADLRLTTTGSSLWIVVAATLSARDLPLPERKAITVAAGAEWKALPADDLVVKPGTALDRSAWVDHAPAGCRGRVIARPDGRLAFASDPATPVRFFGCTGPDWVFANDENADPEAFAEAVRRQGYNMVRFHFLDFHLAGRPRWGKPIDAAAIAATDARAAAGQLLDPARMELVDRLAAALKQRGIYLFLDAMTSWTGFYPVNPWSSDLGMVDLRWRSYGDPAARAHYRAAVTALLTHRNPLTGLTLAEDPMVAVVLGWNEQELNLWRNGWQEPLLASWRAFLARTYADPTAWRAAWGVATPPPASFAEAPIFALDDVIAAGRRGADVSAFLAEADAETQAFFEGVVRAAGYPGIFTNYDHYKNLRYQLARARLGAVTMHNYHDHPSDFIQAGSKVSQSSSLADGLGYLRNIAGIRIAGLPLLLTEYGHVYWNRHRYEEGLSVGAFAALQEIDMLFVHASPVLMKGRAVKPFSVANDPVARASQVVTGLAWRGRAVAPARHQVQVALPRAAVLAQAQEAMSGEQTRLALLTGFSSRVEGGPAAAPAADLTLALENGSAVVGSRFESKVADKPPVRGLAAAVDTLRERGILPAGNRTRVADQLLDARRHQLTVATATLAGVCSDVFSAPVEAGALRLAAASVPVAATVAALDGQALPASARLLLVLATDARNDGEQYEDEAGRTLRKLGSGPVLVRTGRFAIELRRAAGAPALRAWALAQDGTRRDELAVAAGAGGMRLELDSAAWAGGPTPFLELAER
ncbi:MAG: hypothetical protein L6R48_11610 [Planctomycetes bacterium]|nr:hypothetical protein [Planctomycetota bacterium]